MPTKKSSGTSIIEYTSLKRTHTTTKETSTGMSPESLTNRTLKIYLWAQFICVLLTPDTEIVSNRVEPIKMPWSHRQCVIVWNRWSGG